MRKYVVFCVLGLAGLMAAGALLGFFGKADVAPPDDMPVLDTSDTPAELPGDAAGTAGDSAITATDMDLLIATTDWVSLVQEDVWKQEDAVRNEMPTYDAMHEALEDEAQKWLAEKGLDWDDTEGIIALAQQALDGFWDSGPVGTREGYHQGYLARALLEMALRENPENFDLMDQLRETLLSLYPTRNWDNSKNPTLITALWPVVCAQKQLIDSGKYTAVTPKAFDAMMDWVYCAQQMEVSNEDTAAGWQWLLDHAEEGGWNTAQMRNILELGHKCAATGERCTMSVYLDQIDYYDPLSSTEWNRCARRWVTLRGSAKRRAGLQRVWESPSVTFVTTSSP